MRKFNGLRPQDVALLLKLVANPLRGGWLGKDLARELALSASEISESLARCRYCRLLAPEPGSYQWQPRALTEFLLHGLPYVFAVHPGPRTRGLLTGASAPPLSHTFGTEPAYVWPLAAGDAWGAAVVPLYPGAATAAQLDARLHELLALVDALRLGRPRERALAADLLTAALLNTPARDGYSHS